MKSVRKVSTGQGDNYTTGYLLDVAYSKKNYRLIAADLSMQKALNADSKVIQKIFLMIRQINMQWFITFLNNQKK